MPLRGRRAPKVGDKEHIVTRLGWAVAYRFNELPRDVQELLVGQATNVETGSDTVVQLRQQIEAFIDEHADAKLD